MEVKVSGNPGSGNHYEEVSIPYVGNYNPNAREVNTYIQYGRHNSRLSCWFRRLKEEFDKDDRLQKKFDDIERYNTKLPDTIGLEAKLHDGGFSSFDIKKATRSKQSYAEKATKYQYYESALRIDAYLFAKVANRFDTYVMPLISAARPLSHIKQAVYEQVILPIMEEIEANGADDYCLCYNEDDLFGMLYHLTGNCHINWADYDVRSSI